MKNHIARIAVTILFFFFGGISASWASRIPTIKDTFGVNDAAWGLVLLYISIGTLISLPFAGKLIKIMSSKRSTAIFLIGYFILLIGIGYWGELWQLKLNLVAFGVVSNLTNISINTQAINVSKNYKGQIIGSFHGTWSIGGFAASWLGAEMISSHIPPLQHFIYFSAIGIVVSLSLVRYLTSDTQQQENEVIEKKKRFNLPDKNLVLIGILAFFAMFAEGAMTDWSSEYMDKTVQAPINLIGYGLAGYMFTMASGRFLSDFTVRKYGERATLLICGILIFLGLISSVAFATTYTTIASFMVVGFGVSAVVPMAYNLAGHSKSLPPEQALTLITSIGFFGFFIGPVAIGFISEQTSLKIAFSIIAFFGIGVTVLSRFIDFNISRTS